MVNWDRFNSVISLRHKLESRAFVEDTVSKSSRIAFLFLNLIRSWDASMSIAYTYFGFLAVPFYS
jgi:hypothetical protein